MAPVPPWRGKRKRLFGPQLGLSWSRQMDFEHGAQVGYGDALADPVRVEHGGRIGPDLEVVGQQEQFRDALAEGAQNPVVEVGAWARAVRRGPSNPVRRPIVGGRQPMQVVLEGIGDETVPDPDPALALVLDPAVRPQGLLHVAVERLVVRELDVAAQVPGKALFVDDGGGQAARMWLGLDEQAVGLAELSRRGRRPNPVGPAPRRGSGGVRMTC